MNALAAMTRSWPMLGALGAGLVLTALAAGAGGAPQVVLAGLGVAGLGWAVLSLHAGRIVAPRTVLATSAGALAVVGLLVATGAMADAAGLPLAAASVFVVAVALSAAFEVRQGRAADAEPRPDWIIVAAESISWDSYRSAAGPWTSRRWSAGPTRSPASSSRCW